MFGGGFIKDMISSSKGNRSLLKGNEGAAYKNFDASSYKVKYPYKKASFKQASPELIAGIKDYMDTDNKKANRSRVKAFLISIGISLVILLGLSKLFLHVFF